MKPFIRSAYNYDRSQASRESGLDFTGIPSLAVQSAKEETDINFLMARFGHADLIPKDVRVPLEGDFDNVFDFQSAQNAIVAAREQFMALPAVVRKRFQNDPQEFAEFCLDEKNLDEMRKLGLAREVPPVVEEKPVRVEVVGSSNGEAVGSSGSGKVSEAGEGGAGSGAGRAG